MSNISKEQLKEIGFDKEGYYETTNGNVIEYEGNNELWLGGADACIDAHGFAIKVKDADHLKKIIELIT